MITIGIDPGMGGALAAFRDGQLFQLADMPVFPRLHGKGKQINAVELTSLLLEMKDGRDAVVYLEQVNAMPGQGVSSSFHFGESLGVILGVCGALCLPIQMVTPQRWKKAAGLIGKDKDASRTLAIQRHPSFADMLSRKEDNGRSDAICIAEFGE